MGRSIPSAGTTTRVATAGSPEVVGSGETPADGSALVPAEGSPLGSADGAKDGASLGTIASAVGDSTTSAPTVLGSEYASRPAVTRTTPRAVTMAGRRRVRSASNRSAMPAEW